MTQKKASKGKWRVVSACHETRTVTMQRGAETARFQMGSMKRMEGGQ